MTGISKFKLPGQFQKTVRMSDSNDKESSGVVCIVFRQAGAVAGKAAVISMQIADYGVKTVTEAKDWFERSLSCLVPSRDSSITSPASGLESRGGQETGRKKAAKALIVSLEQELATARHELKKAQSNAEITQSKLASQIDELKVEKKSLISDLEKAKSKAGEAVVRENEAKTRVSVLESDLVAAQRLLETPRKEKQEKAKFQPLSDISPIGGEKMISDQTQEKIETVFTDEKSVNAMAPVAARIDEQLTDEQVQTAVFSNETDKIIFSRALVDISSKDAMVRMDAAKTMAGVRHDLSVKALSIQVVSDTSARVRQECIKALTALEMKEGLPAVKRALDDREAPVRLAAVWGLYRLAGPESAATLAGMFSDKDEEIRRRAVTCIGWTGQEKLAAQILPLLSDKSASVRRAAAEAIGNLRSRQMVSTLIERLNDPDESVRKTVLIAIETITGKKLSKSFPKNKKEYERLVARWDERWKEELLG